MHSADIPVLLIIFNRPSKVKRLVDALASVRPNNIYILADGPRVDRPDEVNLCAEARRIATEVPWPCTIHTHFKETNVGLSENIGEGITWFFTQVEHGIIFEDDCIPDSSFFPFCADLLLRYKDDERIMHISGNNFQNGTPRGDGSYYFSHYSHSWGWATWRRAWQYYPEAVANLKKMNDCEEIIGELPFSKAAKKFWIKNLRNNPIWDSVWMYTTWYKKALCILPNQTLVSNIGFGTDATNTKELSSQSDLKPIPLTTILHPSTKEVNEEADNYTFKTVFYVPLWRKIWRKFSGIIAK